MRSRIFRRKLRAVTSTRYRPCNVTAVLVAALATALGGCYDTGFDGPADAQTRPSATTTIAYLREVYTGTPFVIESDVVVTGHVNSSDAAGNFFRSFCIEADGAGIEVMAGVDHLHNNYPPGSRVTLRLKGLCLGESYGTLQVGRLPAPGSGFATEYIGSKPALDAIVVSGGAPSEPPVPALKTIASLTSAACGTLVRIENVRCTPEEEAPQNGATDDGADEDFQGSGKDGLPNEGGAEEPAPVTWAGYRRFTDPEGAEIYTYTRLYADFADQRVPTATCALVGILQRESPGGRFTLKLRDQNDCILQ